MHSQSSQVVLESLGDQPEEISNYPSSKTPLEQLSFEHRMPTEQQKSLRGDISENFSDFHEEVDLNNVYVPKSLEIVDEVHSSNQEDKEDTIVHDINFNHSALPNPKNIKWYERISPMKETKLPDAPQFVRSKDIWKPISLAETQNEDKPLTYSQIQ